MNEGKYAKTHQMIIEEGMKLFIEQGYRSVKITDICSSCGIARPTFYLHFKSKDEIIAAYFNDLQTFSDTINLPGFLDENPWISIIRLLILRINYTCDESKVELITHYITYCLHNTDKVDSEERSDYEEMLIHLIREAQTMGIIQNASDPIYLLSSAFMLADGNLLRWCIRGGSFDRMKQYFWNLESIFQIHPNYRGLWKLEC